MESFNSLIDAFQPISLAQMQAVVLLKRVDTKYLLTQDQLAAILPNLQSGYDVLQVQQTRLNRYHTLYFDTAVFDLYHLHHAGARHRYKVRSRQYVDSQLAFFEVKHRMQAARTEKERVPTAELVTACDQQTSEFVASHLPRPFALEPKLSNRFTRITLVSKQDCERVTLDLNIRFSHHGRCVSLTGLAIAEVKQEQINHQSLFMQQMRAMNIRSVGFSKYCIGVALLYPHIKHNRFKPKLRLIQKLNRGYWHAQPH